MMRLIICIAILLILPALGLAQSGPGGVSNDANPMKNCRLWLDAGDLASPTQSDGTEVHLWIDKSNSVESDEAIWVESHDGITYSEFFTAPLFRSDPAYSINGNPVVSFEEGGMLLMGLTANANLNADLVSEPNGITQQRTVFLAFRTGNDISSRQFIWEQGGGWRGLGIYIYSSELYIGVYDVQGLGFGYSYKKTNIQPNTTYVVSLVLNVANSISIDADFDNQSLKGTINGENFGLLQVGAAHPDGSFGVGAIKKQGDPIGIGGVNSLTAHESSFYDWISPLGDCQGHVPCNNSQVKPFGLTGQFLFKGRLAEIAYYAYSLNDAERIIVENYLAAKYFANVIDNDKFRFQTNYGHDVIGIGAQAGGDEHNISKGDNLFEIGVDNMVTAFKYSPLASRYLLAGHNNNPLQWTNQNTPDSASVKRLKRTWRFDRSGIESGTGDQSVTIRFMHPDSLSGLPPLPQNYKYAVLIDDSNGSLPNFSASSDLTEITLNPLSGWFEGEFTIPHGAYLTIAAVKPTIQFKKRTDFTLETNSLTPTEANVEIELNYSPRTSGIYAEVIFEEGSATNPENYTYSSTGIAFPSGSKTAILSVDIINDLVAESLPVNNFFIILDPTEHSEGFFIGEKDTLIFSIYDDDSDPKATFQSALNDSITEAAGLAQLNIRVNGQTVEDDNRMIRIIDNGTGSAIHGEKYILPNTEWDNLPPPDNRRYTDVEIPYGSNQYEAVFFPVINDGIDDSDKTIEFILEPLGGVTVDGSSVLSHTMVVKDINPEPEVEFLATNSEGFEAVSQPRIVVTLSSPSAKTIEVSYTITGGTATNGANNSNSDYTAETSGTVIFPPGDTISYLYYDPNTGNVAFQVYSDDVEEANETILFELQNPILNAQAGTVLNHTYSIKDYQAFEWTGAAGVGKIRDNTFWIDLIHANTGQSSSVPQRSPRPIDIHQPTENHRPTVTMGKNNQKVMSFDGSSFFRVSGNSDGKSPFINSAGFYDSKAIFFVVTPQSSTSNAQILFEEGGEDVGLNIYLRNNKIYFQVWNTADNDGNGTLAPWGGNDSYVVSDELVLDSTYVVSCHYHSGHINPMRIYVNGELIDTYGSNDFGNADYIGRLFVHSGKIGLGGVYYGTRFNNGPVSNNLGYNFNGQLGEMIYYNDRGADMNTSRIRILHNYLSARFNIPLISSEQVFDLAYADRTNLTTGYVTYNDDVAGIGIMSEGNLHGVAQGPSQLKITGSGLSGTNKFLVWGHNGVSLTNSWPFSYGNENLPGQVKERSGRVWRFSTNPGVSSVENLTVEMNYSESGNAMELTNDRAEFLRLLVSADATDWSGAVVYNPSPVQPNIEEGARVVFEGVIIPNGYYVALGNTSPISISPLPVELTDFDARFEVDHVNLSWRTASEYNNDYFVVERAGDDLKWSEISRTPGAGNSSIQIRYSEKDRNPLSGISYYRLKQVDFDGIYSYSDVVSVFNPRAQDQDVVFLYPNPSKNGMVVLRIPAYADGFPTRVRIIDLRGKMVWEGSFAESENLLEIHYGALKPAIYFIEIKSDIIYESKKLIVQ